MLKYRGGGHSRVETCHVTLPGGGTTDYAVEIYYEAIKNKKYTSFIKAGTKMDMMYMPDAIEKLTIKLKK